MLSLGANSEVPDLCIEGWFSEGFLEEAVGMILSEEEEGGGRGTHQRTVTIKLGNMNAERMCVCMCVKAWKHASIMCVYQCVCMSICI